MFFDLLMGSLWNPDRDAVRNFNRDHPEFVDPVLRAAADPERFRALVGEISQNYRKAENPSCFDSRPLTYDELHREID